MSEFLPVRVVDSVPPIYAVKIDENQIGATLRSLCAALDLARHAQAARIRRDPALADALVIVLLDSPGGQQQTEVLLNWAIPIWLSGLNTARLPEEKQTLVLHMQQKAVAAIERAFAELRAKNASPEAPAPQAPTPEAAQGSLRRVKQKLLLAAEGLTSAAEEIGHFEGEHQALVGRVTALEGRSAARIIGVEPQRLAQVYLFANRLRQRRSWPIAETLAGLAEHFHVADVFDLPAKDWPAVLDWFTSLLEEW